MQNSDHHGDDVVLPTPDEDEMNVDIEQATDVEALQPGAYSVTPMTTAISSPRPQTTTEPTDVSGDDDKDINIDPANVIDGIIIEAEATPVAHIVPTDEPFAIGIQMRRRTTMTTTMDVDEDEASESFRNLFRAIVSNANAVLDINDHLNECHPNRLREDMDKNIRSYYWHRCSFRGCCIIISILGTAIGLGFGLRLDSTMELGDVRPTIAVDELGFGISPIITLNGEYPGQLMGMSVALTSRGESILMGSPESTANPTGGMAQLFSITNDEAAVADTNNTTNNASNNESSSNGTIANLLFSTRGDNTLDKAGSSVATTPHGKAFAVGYINHLGIGYVKVFSAIGERKYTQIGDALFGKSYGDGFASSIAISQFNTQQKKGLLLLVGCQNCGYAHLSAIEEDDQYGPWSRLDRNDNQHLKNEDERSFDVVVAMAGWGGVGSTLEVLRRTMNVALSKCSALTQLRGTPLMDHCQL